jgi:phage shock protein A
MAQKVDQLEAQADAAKELEEFTSGSNLERRFSELEKSDFSADLLLDDLKKKMQSLPDKT